MANQKKIETVKKLKENLGKSKSLVLTDHSGLNHQQMEKLRKAIRKAGGLFMVVKNRLLQKAVEKTVFADKINPNALTGQTSLLLAVDDEIAPLKELVKSVSELNLPKIKQGVLADKILDEERVIRLANLPDKEILLAQLTGMLKNPQTRLVFSLKGNFVKWILVLKALLEKRKN